jgi:hypothetical protein
LSALLLEPVAQPEEHLTFNQGVAGSNPAGLTKKINGDSTLYDSEDNQILGRGAYGKLRAT